LARIATELQIPNVFHVKRVHAVAHRHADVACIAAQVLTRDYPSAAERESVGGTETHRQQCDR
jgi:hypothetical protein